MKVDNMNAFDRDYALEPKEQPRGATYRLLDARQKLQKLIQIRKYTNVSRGTKEECHV